jgi:hypothetical protein
LNVFTLHAEIEGGFRRGFFENFLARLGREKVCFVDLEEEARSILETPERVPVCEILWQPFEGRAGSLAVQGPVS